MGWCLRLGSMVVMLAAGCDGIDLLEQDDEPMGVPREVSSEVIEAPSGAIYDPAVAAAPDGRVAVVWTEHRAHEGEPAANPDVVLRMLGADGLDPETTVLTPWSDAQLRAKPFFAADRFAVLWGDDLPMGVPERKLRWWPLAGEVAAGPDEAYAVGDQERQQRDASSVAVLGDRAAVLYRDTTDEHAWRIAVFDAATGESLHDRHVASSRFGSDATSITAGEDGFLVLRLSSDPSEGSTNAQLHATVLDRDGGLARELGVVASRFPPDRIAPVEAAFDRGRFVFPLLDFDEVTVDRPCCPECNVVQPPTCDIEDYRIEVARLSESGELTSSGCLDCRVDVGIAIPQVALHRGTVYMQWSDFLAAIPNEGAPSPERWIRLEHPDPALRVGYTDLAVRDGEAVLVGRGGLEAGQQALVVSRVEL